MRMQIAQPILTLAAALLLGCARSGPEIRTEAFKLQAGQVIAVDGDRRLAITAPEAGHLVVYAEHFGESSGHTDLSGVRKTYIFLPQRHIDEGHAQSVDVTKADGIKVFQYSRNTAFPEDFCFQELSDGSINIKDSGKTVILGASMRTPRPAAPTDAKCDASEFLETVEITK